MAVNTQRTHTAKLVLRGSQLVCGIIVMSTAAYVLSQFTKLDNDVSAGIAASQQNLQEAMASGSLTPLQYNATDSAAYQAAVQAALDAVNNAGMSTTTTTASTGNRKLMQVGYYGSVFAGVKNRVGYVVFAGIVLMLHGAHYLAVALSKGNKINCNLTAVPATIVELVLTCVTWIFVVAAGSVLASWGTCAVSDAGAVCGSYNAAMAFAWIGWLLLTGSIILAVIELTVRGRSNNAQDAKAVEVGNYGSAPPQVVVTQPY